MQLKHHFIWEEWLIKQKNKVQPEMDFFVELICDLDIKIYPRVSYGAPFLYRYGPLGYFGMDKKLGLYFAFYWGKLLKSNSFAELFFEDNRKMVKLVFLTGKMDDIDFIGKFLVIVERAMEIDNLKYKKNKSGPSMSAI